MFDQASHLTTVRGITDISSTPIARGAGVPANSTVGAYTACPDPSPCCDAGAQSRQPAHGHITARVAYMYGELLRVLPIVS
ncbi:MAG: hypothetical protein V3U76_16280 [Granulosicoccus sp.]